MWKLNRDDRNVDNNERPLSPQKNFSLTSSENNSNKRPQGNGALGDILKSKVDTLPKNEVVTSTSVKPCSKKQKSNIDTLPAKDKSVCMSVKACGKELNLNVITEKQVAERKLG